MPTDFVLVVISTQTMQQTKYMILSFEMLMNATFVGEKCMQT